MSVVVRPMRRSEARQFLELQRASVRGLASTAYPAEVVEAWAPVPVTCAALDRFLANSDGEIRLVAEECGRPVGIGALVVPSLELRACYVAPDAARRGVGRAIVSAIERRAMRHGLDGLRVEASINAEPFYAAVGYVAIQRGTVEIVPGVAMAAVTMFKSLRPASGEPAHPVPRISR